MRVAKYVLPIVTVSLLAVVLLTTAVSAMGVPESRSSQGDHQTPPVAPVPASSGLTGTSGLTPKTPASPIETGGVSQGGPQPQSGPDQKVPKFWRDGDRLVPVEVLDPPGTGTPGTGAARSSGASDQEQRSVQTLTTDPSDGESTGIRVSVGGVPVSLPGGVVVTLDSAWSRSETDAFFTANGIEAERVSELGFTPNAFLVETAPGIPGLVLSNSLAVQDGVQLASPDWELELEVEQGPESDDHGDTMETATNLPLNTPVAGNIRDENDRDYFRFTITESTYIAVGNHSATITPNWVTMFTLYDHRGTALTWGGMLRQRLSAGTYYVVAGQFGWENYQVEVRTIPDHGHTRAEAHPVQAAPKGTVPYVYRDFHSSTDVDFFRFELDEPADIVIDTGDLWKSHDHRYVFPLSEVNLQLFDADGNPVGSEALGLSRKGRAYDLEAGVYYIRLSPYFLRTSHKDAARGFHALGNNFINDLRVYPNGEYTDFIDGCSAVESDFDDPLYGCQWHLENTSDNSGTAGEDINVAPAWAHTMGQGVNVAVVDNASDLGHEDLTGSYLSVDYVGPVRIRDPFVDHGLGVAGLIAARDNGLGVRGVAPEATLFALNALERPALTNLLDALTRLRGTTAVSNNSWGFTFSQGPHVVSKSWETALETGITEGLDGKGTLYVFSAGNKHARGLHVNLKEGKNHYSQVTVCGVTAEGTRMPGSETGYSLWVCAPAAQVTLDRENRYRADFGGTSAAAAVASGVAALVRSANPDLTWRDVKLILAASARKNDPRNPGWETGAHKHAFTSERYSYNPEYGFGVVDAGAAVTLAKAWTNLPPMQTASAQSAGENHSIPDPPSRRQTTSFTRELTLDTDINFTEFVEVRVDINHPAFRNIGITLTSPSGAVSRLAVPSETAPDGALSTKFRLGSARHLGEDPSGTWTLEVSDHRPAGAGKFKGWEITVYGHQRNDPIAGLPYIAGTAQIGRTLTASTSGVFYDGALTSGVFTYQWIANDGGQDADIRSATDAGYTLVEADLGRAIKVRVSYAELSAPVGPVAGAGQTGGPARVGDTLQAETWAIRGDAGLSNISYAYQWIRSDGGGDAEVRDATGASYTLVEADLGKTIKVRRSFSVLSAAVGPVAEFANAPATGEPTISGPPHVGETLEADTSGIGDKDGLTGVSYDYQWVSNDGTNDSDIQDATGASYTLVEADLGKTIRVRVSFTDDAGSRESMMSGPTEVVDLWAVGSFTNYPANHGGVTAFTFQFSFVREPNFRRVYPQDMREAILRAKGGRITEARRLNPPSNIDWELTVEPSGYDEVKIELPSVIGCLALGSGCWDSTIGWQRVELTVSGPLQIPKTPATGAPVISGPPQVGQTLEADTSSIRDTEGLSAVSYNYQWIRSDGNADTDIPGATGSSYTLVEADMGRTIRVRVSFTDDAGSEESVTSGPTAAIDGPLLKASIANYPASHDGTNAFTFELSFSEEPTPGLSPGTLRDNAFTVTGGTIREARQLEQSKNIGWEITVEPAGSANVKIELPATADCNANGAICTGDGRMLSTWVDMTVPGPGSQTQTQPPNTRARGTPTISGAPHVGETLEASTSGISDDDGLSAVAYDYQWIRSDWNGDADIQDATGASYTLVEADRGKTIRVRVSFADDAENPESVISWPTGTVGLPLFKASVPNYPASHDGATTFTFELHFSDEPFHLKIREVENDIFTVRGGTIAKAWHLNPPSGIGWRIVVKPSGNADVRILLPASTHCRATGKVCTMSSTTSNGWNFRPLSTEVRLTVPGPSSLTQTSTNAPPTGAPSISGTPHVGVTLEADTSGIGDDDGLINVAYNYQWIRAYGLGADTDIRDATGSSYTVLDADLGKTIKVRVSFTDDAGSEESVKSAATVPVVEPKSGLLAGFTLVDASDQAVLATLSDGATLALADPANGSYGIRADTKSGAQIGSVRLQLTGAKSVDQTDGFAPYSLYGDQGENGLNGGNLPVGAYTLTATAYSEGGLGGDTLGIIEMSFTVTGPAQEVQNSPATGAPTISGTARVGQTLTASTDGIADQDGLPSVFTYQWKRYDADGNTFEAIIGHDSSTYTLAESEEGKRVKVEVTFTDSGGSDEGPLVSDAYPSSETVGAAGQGNTPPTASNGTVTTDEDADYVFAAADFSYLSSDGADLVSVKITGLPAAGEGALAVDGAPIAAADLPQTVTATELADGMLTYAPPANANGTGYSSFTFRVNDGTADSPEYTMTINVNPVNDPARGAPTIIGTLRAGETLVAETSDIGDDDGLTNVSYSYQWIRSDGTFDADILSATGASYTLVEADLGKTIKVRVSFTDDAGSQESVIGLPPLQASISDDYPRSHDGATAFTFELSFSEEPTRGLSYKTLRDRAFTVTEGTIKEARRLEPPSNIGWRIRVEPSVSTDVVILLPATTDCTADGAICTRDGRMLSAEVSLTVPGPDSPAQIPNTPATGAPTIGGTPQVGQTLEAETSGIGDDDGLNNVSYDYQWIRNDGTSDADILSATGSSYTLAEADLGMTIRVRVSFTDDAGNGEQLTSAATAPVAARTETPTWSVSADAARVAEGDRTTLTVAITNGRTFDSSQTISLAATGTAGSADYRLSATTLTLAEGASSATANVSATDDATVEDDETVILTASHGGQSIGSATVTIPANDAPAWSVSVDAAQVAEGDSTTLTVAITNGRTFDSSQTITLAATGTAGSADYRLSATTITLPAGHASATANVSATDDATVEDDETVILTASHGGQSIGSATVTIPANDAPAWSVSADAARVAEGGDSTLTVAITNGNTFDSSQTISLAATGTASGADYDLPESITLPAGHASATANVSATDDATVEDDETVILTASHGGQSIGSATVTIPANDAPAWSVSADAAQVAEGGDSTLTVAITNGNTFDSSQTISLAVTGTAGSADYDLPEFITLPAGHASATANVSATDDATVEGDETVILTASHGGLSIGSATLTIPANDAPAWSVSANAAQVAEGGDSTLTVAITNGNTFDSSQTISLAVTGTASGADYRLSATTLTLAQGESSVTANVSATDDNLEEGDETVILTASHGGLSIGSATLTIPANDAPLSTDASLSSLGLSGIDIGAFSSETTAYSASVEYDLSTTTVTAVAGDDGASVVITDSNGSTAGTSRDVSLSAGDNEITVTVTAEDGDTTRVYTVTVTRAEPDVAWGERLPDLDIALDSDAGPTGLWANDTSMWVITDWFAGRVQVYARSDGAEQEDRGFTLADWSGFAVAMWSNGDTLWVADFTGWVLAYRLSDGVREPDRDLDTSILREAGNRNPTGLWSNGTVMWVADGRESRVFAYRLDDGARESAREFQLTGSGDGSISPAGLWSNGETLLVSTGQESSEVLAYRLSDGSRQAARNIDTIAANTRGIWSDGETLWVVDDQKKRIYAYAVPGLGSGP